MPCESSELFGDFDAYYRITEDPVMRRIECAVTGSDYGASSNTTRDEADRLASLLGLAPGKLLLDFGSGAGWPGIHLARTTGCALVLTDVPLEGLRRARRRMWEEDVSGAAIAASAALLPLRDAVFDAVTSSDVFC
ncbi:MAG: class I SAM-dependent methyltransferase [Actinomycetota bacterium]